MLICTKIHKIDMFKCAYLFIFVLNKQFLFEFNV